MSKLHAKTNGFVTSIFHKAFLLNMIVLFLRLQNRFSRHTSVPVFQSLLQYENFSHRSRTPKKYFQI